MLKGLGGEHWCISASDMHGMGKLDCIGAYDINLS